MDKDHRPLPRFADIEGQHPGRNTRDDEGALSDRHHTSVQHVGTRPEPAPPPLHPPVQSHSARTELLYQSSSAIYRQPSQPQFPHQRHAEMHNPSPPPAFSQPVPALSTYDRDRIAHSQSSSMDNVAVGMSTTPYTSYSRQQQGGVAEGGVAKPKKLHREVEQKRRMRMAEQIVELRKWVSNRNGGKTDKVSVLQDAVTYVKDAAKRIEELQGELQRSRAECSHLRSLLNKSPHLSSLPGSQAQIPPPQAQVAPISHLGSGMRRHSAVGVVDNELRHPSQLAAMQTAYQERHLHPGGSDVSISQGGMPVAGPSNFAVTHESSVMMRAGPGQRTSHAFGSPAETQFPAVSTGQTNPAQTSHDGQPGLPRSYYGPVHEGERMMTSAPGPSLNRRGRDVYQGVSLPRLRREDEEQKRSERKSEN